jgi:hypothetical protein
VSHAPKRLHLLIKPQRFVKNVLKILLFITLHQDNAILAVILHPFGTQPLINVKHVLLNIQFSTTLHLNVREKYVLQAKDGISIRSNALI